MPTSTLQPTVHSAPFLASLGLDAAAALLRNAPLLGPIFDVKSRTIVVFPTPLSPTTRILIEALRDGTPRSEEHTSELQSQFHRVCRLLLEKKKKKTDKSWRLIGARELIRAESTAH